MTTRITHIGGPTVLLEVNGWRLLTDPTFDPPGRRYGFGWGSSSRKLTGPAIAAADLDPIDAVLLSHDHHGDNLDTTGRAPYFPRSAPSSPPPRVPGGSAATPAAWRHGRPPSWRPQNGPPSTSRPPLAAIACR